MIMRYHFGLGIGHMYSHTQPVPTTPPPQQPCPSECTMESHINELEHPTDSLQSEPADFESVPSSPNGSDLESDEECVESESDSILGDYVDMDGWDGAEVVTFNEYEF